MGPYLLRQELKKRGIPEEITEKISEKYLGREDVVPLALRAVMKKKRFLSIADEAERKRKIYDFLLRRGFGYDEIGEAVARIEREIAGSGDRGAD